MLSKGRLFEWHKRRDKRRRKAETFDRERKKRETEKEETIQTRKTTFQIDKRTHFDEFVREIPL